MTKDNDDLLLNTDAAAIALLKRIGVGDSFEGQDREAVDASIAESVKVFDSVSAYVKWRRQSDNQPPKPAARGLQLRDKFNGGSDAATGRGRKPPTDRAGA